MLDEGRRAEFADVMRKYVSYLPVDRVSSSQLLYCSKFSGCSSIVVWNPSSVAPLHSILLYLPDFDDSPAHAEQKH